MSKYSEAVLRLKSEEEVFFFFLVVYGNSICFVVAFVNMVTNFLGGQVTIISPSASLDSVLLFQVNQKVLQY